MPAARSLRGSDTSSLKSSPPSTRPPSYGRHFHDELLSPPAHRSVTLHSIRATRPRSLNQFHLTQMLQVLTSVEPLILTVDNGLLYPPPPSHALYHLPRNLTWSGNEIFLFRSLPVVATRRSSAVTRDLALYTMRRTPFTHEISLMPRREGLKSAVMRGRRSLLGSMTWQVEVKGQIFLKYSKGKWKNAAGKVVASEKQTNTDERREELGFDTMREEITIEGDGVEVWVKDLIVAAWVTRIWQGHAKVSLARTLLRGQGNRRSSNQLFRACMLTSSL
jgi:hypothetical protein